LCLKNISNEIIYGGEAASKAVANKTKEEWRNKKTSKKEINKAWLII